MKKFLVTGIALVFTVFLSACNKQNEADRVKRDTYVYDKDIAVELGDTYGIDDICSCFVSGDNIYTLLQTYDAEKSGYSYVLRKTGEEGDEVIRKWHLEQGEIVKGAGYVAGSDDYIVVEGNAPMSDKEEKWTLFRFGMDGTQKAQTDVTDVFAKYPQMLSNTVAVDGNGLIHVAGESLKYDKNVYHVLSSKGEPVFSLNLDDCSFVRFLEMQDGRVAVDLRNPETGRKPGENQSHHVVEVFDDKAKTMAILLEYDELTDGGESTVSALNVLDDQRIVFATQKGLFVSDYSFENRECIYSFERLNFWRNPVVEYIYAKADGTFSLVMERGSGELYYQHLVKTDEDVLEIELAIGEGGDIYSEAIVEFNKTHKKYKIVAVSDYDETALKTKVLAKEGPVIIDLSLLHSDSNKDLWEPLEDIYQKPEILNNINNVALSLTASDDNTYAVTVDYYILTLISHFAESGLTYDEIIRQSENANFEYFLDSELTVNPQIWTAAALFNRSVEDSAYINDSFETLFDGDNFAAILDLIEKKVPHNKYVPYITGLKSGEVLYNLICIDGPIQAAFWERMCEDGLKVAGMPGKQGADNFICARHRLAIRKSASEEEKEAAKEFMTMLLSYEMQQKLAKSPNFNLSVRNDVLKEQIHSLRDGEYISPPSLEDSPYGFLLKNPNYERIELFLNDLIDGSMPYKEPDEAYLAILEEEFEAYFGGEISREELSDRLSSRVGIYLEEKK